VTDGRPRPAGLAVRGPPPPTCGLHDLFAFPFGEVAAILGRSGAARKLASRARRRVNGAAGLVVAAQGRPLSVMAFTVAGGRIVEIDILADPERLRRLDLAAPHG
jgi:hypothetical protein